MACIARTLPRWIVNFPTKQHWRAPSRLAWIIDGLQDLRRFLLEKQVKSIAIPALGAGNGGLAWDDVRTTIDKALGDLDIEIIVFEPTQKYQSIANRRLAALQGTRRTDRFRRTR